MSLVCHSRLPLPLAVASVTLQLQSQDQRLQHSVTDTTGFTLEPNSVERTVTVAVTGAALHDAGARSRGRKFCIRDGKLEATQLMRSASCSHEKRCRRDG